MAAYIYLYSVYVYVYLYSVYAIIIIEAMLLINYTVINMISIIIDKVINTYMEYTVLYI